MIELNPKTFLDLHEKLLQKFKNENGGILPTRKTQLYGLNNFASDNKVASLRKSIAENKKVEEYFNQLNKGLSPNETGYQKVETKRSLYQPLLDIEKKRSGPIIQVDEAQYNAWLIYLGISETKEEDSAVEYFGYCYSYKDNIIFESKFLIDFSQSNIPIKMNGFHTKSPFDLFGNGRIQKNYLYASLSGERLNDWLDEFHLIANIGNQTNPDLICANFLGVSSYDYPTSGEIILVTEKYKNNEKIRIIKQYLTLKKSRLKTKYFDSPDSMMVKGKYLDEINHMIGEYRVLNFEPRGDLMISKFTIDESYSSRFITSAYKNDNQNNQVCLLSISSVLNNRLCISTHPNLGTGVIAYVLINIPKISETRNKGVFCSVGQSGNMPVSGNITLEKVSSDVSPIRVPKDEIKLFLETQPDILDAFSELVKLERRKTPLF